MRVGDAPDYCVNMLTPVQAALIQVLPSNSAFAVTLVEQPLLPLGQSIRRWRALADDHANYHSPVPGLTGSAHYFWWSAYWYSFGSGLGKSRDEKDSGPIPGTDLLSTGRDRQHSKRHRYAPGLRVPVGAANPVAKR